MNIINPAPTTTTYIYFEYQSTNVWTGRVLDKTQPEDRIHIKARLVKFSWQRGNKIGQDQFVSCMNIIDHKLNWNNRPRIFITFQFWQIIQK